MTRYLDNPLAWALIAWVLTMVSLWTAHQMGADVSDALPVLGVAPFAAAIFWGMFYGARRDGVFGGDA